MKSVNLVAEATSYLSLIYSSISANNVDLCIELFKTLNEFASVRSFRIYYVVNKSSFVHFDAAKNKKLSILFRGIQQTEASSLSTESSIT